MSLCFKTPEPTFTNPCGVPAFTTTIMSPGRPSRISSPSTSREIPSCTRIISSYSCKCSGAPRPGWASTTNMEMSTSLVRRTQNCRTFRLAATLLCERRAYPSYNGSELYAIMDSLNLVFVAQKWSTEIYRTSRLANHRRQPSFGAKFGSNPCRGATFCNQQLTKQWSSPRTNFVPTPPSPCGPTH